ncbi:hypothetical protein FVF72_04320 [Methanothermobacter sp. KEPCO-1]|uniref:Uncharacterized protein n=1 Tax=Methanothermobacter marburgensis (strain ATCC BAA-927 / DSM 2133 / JCM 14651 / NBRC 100331 / OCM 82 / Marburg) TaxID=79929 RepID=D9PYV8_METTM|nr:MULTISPECIES: hypothetical protein [Methanothermobacter]ADL57653.1 conserved hypothetical protein [Methanothermobacter marburgensis str. Marburg]QEF94445.1 hypothetical protein FVF72_04320 [Methanothermobacter sp. KEPCO-1]WBF09886.1 hypothetical protein ISG34_00215 [Methanothermobacter marburgensis]
MTQKKGLGMGLDALIQSRTRKELKETSDSVGGDVQVEAVIREVKRNPRITLWSARSAAVLRYLKKTQPEFSISREASDLIERAVKEKYPEIWEMFSELQ